MSLSPILKKNTKQIKFLNCVSPLLELLCLVIVSKRATPFPTRLHLLPGRHLTGFKFALFTTMHHSSAAKANRSLARSITCIVTSASKTDTLHLSVSNRPCLSMTQECRHHLTSKRDNSLLRPADIEMVSASSVCKAQKPASYN